MKTKYQAPDVKVINFDLAKDIMDYTSGDNYSAPDWMVSDGIEGQNEGEEILNK